MDYEKEIQRLQEIVQKLENEEISLEKNILLVEEGTKITEDCRKYLDEAEFKMKKIVDNE